MLLPSVFLVISLLPRLISASSQFPSVNGVIGGVPHNNALTSKTLNETLANDSSSRTPGKLRVVENSGVCGAFILCMTHPLSY